MYGKKTSALAYSDGYALLPEKTFNFADGFEHRTLVMRDWNVLSVCLVALGISY